MCINNNCYNCRKNKTCHMCKTGRWGAQCDFECTCLGGSCDLTYGYCVSCPDGYYNASTCIPCEENCKRCNINQCLECYAGYRTQEGKCIKVEKSDTCIGNHNADTGECTLCKIGYWGFSCNEHCSAYCLNRTCSITNGYCPCKVGHFGSSCQYSCSMGCSTECDPYYGVCYPCMDGFYGERCNETCPHNCLDCNVPTFCTRCKKGFYGELCNNTCGFACLYSSCDADGRCPCIDKYADQPYCFDIIKPTTGTTQQEIVTKVPVTDTTGREISMKDNTQQQVFSIVS